MHCPPREDTDQCWWGVPTHPRVCRGKENARACWLPARVGSRHTQRDVTMPRDHPPPPVSNAGVGGGGGGGGGGGSGWYLDDHGHGEVLVRTCCTKCQATLSTLRYCARCKTAAYCNDVCQRADWAAHKLDCKELSRLHERSRAIGVAEKAEGRPSRNAKFLWEWFEVGPRGGYCSPRHRMPFN